MNKNKRPRHDENSLFIRVPKQAAFDKNLTAIDKAVLVSIGSWINSENNSFHMSRPDITERAGLIDPQTIDISIKTLEQLGYLQVKRGGKGRENYYTVVFNQNESEKLAEMHREKPLPRDVAKAKRKAKKSKSNNLPINRNIIPIAKKKLPRKVIKTPVDMQEPVNNIESVYNYWIKSAKKQGVLEHAEHKNKHAIKKLLVTYTLDELKSIISFIWSIWIIDSNIDKTQMDLGILINSPSFRASIINQYTEFKEMGYCEDDFESFNEQMNSS